MEDAIAKLGDYMARIGTAYDLDAMDTRALMTTLPEAALPGAKAAASLSGLKTWLAEQLPGA